MYGVRITDSGDISTVQAMTLSVYQQLNDPSVIFLDRESFSTKYDLRYFVKSPLEHRVVDGKLVRNFNRLKK